MKAKTNSRSNKKLTKNKKAELIKSIVWIVVIILVFYFSLKIIGTDNIQEKVEKAGIFGPLILIFAKAATIVFAPLGGLPFYVAAGTLFGFWKGLIYILLGDFLGFTISFYISRHFGSKMASHFVSKDGMIAVKNVMSHIETRKGLIQTCLFFVGFPEAVSYGGGLTKVKYPHLIATLMIIELIPVAIVVFLGENLAKSTNSLMVLTVITILTAMAGVFWLYHKAKKEETVIPSA